MEIHLHNILIAAKRTIIITNLFKVNCTRFNKMRSL